MSGLCRRLLAAAVLVLVPAPVFGHAFGARYDLPLPLWLYLTGAGAAVALTFCLVAVLARATPKLTMRMGTAAPILSRMAASPALRLAIRALSVLLFILVLLAGGVGRQDPIHNFAPPFVWVIWWVGLAFFVILIGNVWPVINPWSAIYDAAARLTGRRGRKHSPLAYPAGLGVWPSVVLFAAFVWIELVSTAGEHPRALAGLIVAYSVLTWAGMILFGRDTWLNAGETFHQVFGVLGRFAPLGARNGRIVLRPYGAGLFAVQPVRLSMMVLIIVMLSAVTFDGFVETPAWAGFLEWLSQNRALRPALVALQDIDIDVLGAVKSAALLLFPGLFLAVYLGFCAASSVLAGGGIATMRLARILVLSLVPIAVAYHVAHYLSYLLLAGQLIIPLASDPFGWGWDLFGSAGRAMDIGIIDAATVWYVAIFAIVIGHVIAVWLAHTSALALYGDPARALLSQVPMLILMVCYTITSLWILSQPIVEA